MTKLLGFFGMVPRWLYALLAGAGIIALGYHLHGNAVKSAYAAAHLDGVNEQKAADAAAIAAANARANAINSSLKETNDAEARNIAAAVDDLRLRGPGKAVCPGSAAPSSSAGGRVPASGPADVAVDQVPGGERVDLIALPYADLLGFAERCDLNRAEALTWRESDRQQSQVAKPKE